MKKHLFLFLLVSLFSSSIGAQGNYLKNDIADSLLMNFSINQDILNHYDIKELAHYYMEEPEHLIKIDWVHNHSYKIIHDEVGEISYSRQNSFINNFDVSKYEDKRAQDERAVLNFEKYGITIKLLAKNELYSAIDEVVQNAGNFQLTSFPDNEGANGYTDKSDWIIDHPDLAELLNLN